MEMIIFPAMDVLDDKVVKLDTEKHRDIEKTYGTPAEISKRWKDAGAEWIHTIDLNAALIRGEPNLELIPALVEQKFKIQWGGGVRDDESLAAVILSGVQNVIVGTRAIDDPKWLESAARQYPNQLVVAVDARGTDMLIEGWQEFSGQNVLQFMSDVGKFPIKAFLYTDISVEGRGEGLNWDNTESVLDSSPRPVIVAGGVSSLDDIRKLKEKNAHGVVLGSALYTETISLKDSLAV